MLPLRPSLQQLQKQAKELLKDIPQLENLAAAQFTIARQYGFESWAKLKHHLEANQPPEQHEQLARDLSAAYTKGDAMAIRQINWNYGTSFPWDHDRLKMPPRSLKDARRMVARACEPPFYTIDWNESSLSVRGPQPLRHWDTIIAVMKEHRHRIPLASSHERCPRVRPVVSRGALAAPVFRRGMRSHHD